MSKRKKRKMRVIEDDRMPVGGGLVGNFGNGSYHTVVGADGAINNTVALREDPRMVLHTDEFPKSFVNIGETNGGIPVTEKDLVDGQALMNEINKQLADNMREYDDSIMNQMLGSAKPDYNESQGLFQQQPGKWGDAVNEINRNVARIPPTVTTVANTGGMMKSASDVMANALDSHRREIDRLTKHVGQLQSELSEERIRGKRQADVIADLMGRVRALEDKPIAKKKRGTA